MFICLQNAVYPACAGIDRGRRFDSVWAHRLPRMRGDRPHRRQQVQERVQFTPHARGSTRKTYFNNYLRDVYPACAGIDPMKKTIATENGSLPRMRGDRPLICYGCGKATRFTPHARGSTSSCYVLPYAAIVYPACAGIDPASSQIWISWISLPRMRGDRPADFRRLC